jgi:hypothetical protein
MIRSVLIPQPFALGCLVLAAATCASLSADNPTPASVAPTDPHAAAHGAHAGHGTNAPGAKPAANTDAPKASDFIKLDPASPKTVHLSLISAYNEANYGMNFNGFAKGGARLILPKDWKVKVTFRNQSPVPHSVIVVERPMVKKLQMGQPSFKGASSPDPVRGTTGPAVNFEFVADEAGDFAIACGFPAHAANGHWIALEVSDTATQPSLQFGKDTPYVPK